MSEAQIRNSACFGVSIDRVRTPRITRIVGVLGGTLVGLGWLFGFTGTVTPARAAVAAVTTSNACSQLDPVMPPSTGTETPAGFPIQMSGAVLAPAPEEKTLALAYYEWNDMRCSQYTHRYRWRPPNYYYYDCVGFTGLTTKVADPTAWASVRRVLHLKPGYVPTPLSFATFFQRLGVAPQPGWQAAPDVTALRPGDILAWQPSLPDGRPNSRAVGHSVMPLVTPRPIPSSDSTRWEVVVMDSTAGGHGPDDTRRVNTPLSERNAPIRTRSGRSEPSGLGIGTIVLDTTRSGKVTGVEWDVGDRPEQIDFGAGHPLADRS